LSNKIKPNPNPNLWG